MAVAFVDEKGREVDMTVLFPENGENVFRATIAGMWAFQGSWSALTHFAGSQDWKHIDTIEGKRRIAARA